MWEGLKRSKVGLFIAIQASEQQLPWRTVRHGHKTGFDLLFGWWIVKNKKRICLIQPILAKNSCLPTYLGRLQKVLVENKSNSSERKKKKKDENAAGINNRVKQKVHDL